MWILILFGLIFVGFVANANMTKTCPHCQARVDKKASVCAKCGRDM